MMIDFMQVNQVIRTVVRGCGDVSDEELFDPKKGYSEICRSCTTLCAFPDYTMCEDYLKASGGRK